MQVRIGELSRTSGVPVPTIKYYLREGLLAPGASTAPNQATYGPEHLRRLRLIRALLDVGKLPVAAIKEIMYVVEQPQVPPHALMGLAHRYVTPTGPREHSPEWDAARAEAVRRVDALGWRVEPESVAFDQLADVLITARRLDFAQFLGGWDTYAQAAGEVADRDLTVLAERAAPAGDGTAQRVSMVETVVLGTVLGDAMLQALRRLAQQDASARRFAADA
jgi:DNA-binding transcriptional MerR regulator